MCQKVDEHEAREKIKLERDLKFESAELIKNNRESTKQSMYETVPIQGFNLRDQTMGEILIFYCMLL